MVFGNSGGIIFYPTASLSPRDYRQNYNTHHALLLQHFKGTHEITLLMETTLHFSKTKWHLPQTPFYPPAHPLPVPVVSGSGYPSMEIQRWGGKRRTIDVSGSKGNMQVESIDLTSKLVTWGETMVFLPRSLKLLCLMKESREKPPIRFLNTIPPARGKLLPNFGNGLSVRIDF